MLFPAIAVDLNDLSVVRRNRSGTVSTGVTPILVVIALVILEWS
jgi:hypothetical protein